MFGSENGISQIGTMLIIAGAALLAMAMLAGAGEPADPSAETVSSGGEPTAGDAKGPASPNPFRIGGIALLATGLFFTLVMAPAVDKKNQDEDMRKPPRVARGESSDYGTPDGGYVYDEQARWRGEFDATLARNGRGGPAGTASVPGSGPFGANRPPTGSWSGREARGLGCEGGRTHVVLIHQKGVPTGAGGLFDPPAKPAAQSSID